VARSSSLSNVTDQVVEILRDGMLSGRWRDTLPGRDQLAVELGVSHTTMEAAMRRLAMEGLLVSQGTGKRRRIVLPSGSTIWRHFKLSILVYESADRYSPLLMGLLDQLNKNGITAKFAAKSLLDLGMDAKKVSRFVRSVPSDAWIVGAGTHEVLEWFSNESVPVFAFFGGWTRLPVAGVGVRKDIQPVIRQLVDLGHRRIVLLARGTHTNPEKQLFIRNFLNSLRNEGIEPGSYNLPVFGYQPKELHRCLDSLFKVSPPTAIFVSEGHIMLAVRDYLARRGILAPRDVSLICFDHDQSFDWCDPVVAHYAWDIPPITRRVVRWAKNVARGKDDHRQTFSMSRFIEGGTIGPAPRGR
jgi:DNA-binding LacI/PurR family transcriptional regulator/DNA-binding transcriptional regulator YhcF (GntR family)